MAYHYGSEIIVSSPPRGLFREGTIKTGETPRPGTIMQIDASAGLTSGTNNWTYEIYNADADGGRPKGGLFILLPDPNSGMTWGLNTTAFTATTTEYFYSAYAAGDHCFVYTPMPGEEFNLLADDAGGSAAFTVGDVLIVEDATGTLMATTGTPETEMFMALATSAAQSADAPYLLHVMYTGY